MLARKEKIRDFIASEIARDIKAEDLPYEFDLVETGVVDSLSLVRLIAWLGENFGLSINEIILNTTDFSTINQIDAFIENQSLQRA